MEKGEVLIKSETAPQLADRLMTLLRWEHSPGVQGNRETVTSLRYHAMHQTAVGEAEHSLQHLAWRVDLEGGEVIPPVASNGPPEIESWRRCEEPSCNDRSHSRLTLRASWRG